MLLDLLATGPGNLPPRDRGLFRYSAVALLAKSRAQKQAWLNAVLAALKHQAYREDQQQEELALSRRQSILVKWLSTFYVQDASH